jgi:hypothetical protein
LRRLAAEHIESVVNTPSFHRKRIVKVRIFETLRSPERQSQLYLKGKTFATAYWSWHQYGRAYDLVFLTRGGNPTWSGIYPWDLLSKIGEKIGVRSAGLEWGWDWGHFWLPDQIGLELRAIATLHGLRHVKHPLPPGVSLPRTSLITATICLQRALNRRLETVYSLEPDGVFGDNTESALRHWQALSSLKADGILGPRSLGSLEAQEEYDET